MINTDRIVPVQKIDLISLYGLIVQQNSSFGSLAKLAADTIDGDYQVKTNSAVVICDAPVKSVDIDATASSVSACTVFFIADPHYEGFTIDGVAEETEGTDVVADGITLWKAVLSSGDITISKVGF